MMFDVKQEVAALSEQTRATRRELHAWPELGFREVKTAELIEQRLAACGIATRRCAGTGVIGMLRGGKPGKTALLRADMDALPINEENDLPYRSRTPGVMHACGHDCHVAMQLAVAEILAKHKASLAGTVVFLFQPNEEEAGAATMIAEGALQNPRPDAVFGLHVWSPLPIGTVGIVAGPMWASSYYFRVTLRGAGTHGCLPERGVSPIEAGRHVLNAIASMQTMEYSRLDEPTLITVGSLHAGDYMNTIPDELVMEGSIRCLHRREKQVHARFTELVQAVAAAYRCACNIELTCGNSLLENDPALAKLAREAAAAVFGEAGLTDAGVRQMAGDDFAEFMLDGIPGLYALVGMGNPEKGSDAPHHSKEFRVDETVLDLGVALQLNTVLAYLGQ